jgi:hypothetical protein
VHFANITMAGSKLWTFLENHPSNYSAIAMAEVHKKGTEVKKFQEKLSKVGWKGFHTPAQDSEKSEAGCKGGTSIIARPWSKVHDAGAPWQTFRLLLDS